MVRKTRFDIDGGEFVVKKRFYSPAGGYGGTFDGLSKHPERVRVDEERKKKKKMGDYTGTSKEYQQEREKMNMIEANEINKDDRQIVSIVGYIILALIALILLALFWYIIIPLGILLAIYLFIRKN